MAAGPRSRGRGAVPEVRHRFPSPARKMAARSGLLAWCVQQLRGDFGLDVGEEVVR